MIIFLEHVDGVLIENDPDKEKMEEDYFNRYFSFRYSEVTSADVNMCIPNTSFSADLSVLVAERLKKR